MNLPIKNFLQTNDSLYFHLSQTNYLKEKYTVKNIKSAENRLLLISKKGNYF